ASQETTATLLASAALLLMSNPSVLADVRASSSWRDAADEAVRYYSPVQMTLRRMTRDETIGDSVVPAGAHVLAVLGAANRDGAVFERPDEFLPDRAERHIAFGVGSHACPGAALANA